MEKMASDGPKWDPRGFFPTNPNLANILGRTDLDFEDFYFLGLLDPKFLDFQVPRSPNFWISRFPDFQTPPPRPPPPPPPTDEPSDPNLTPLPTHPGIKYVARALAAIFLFVCVSDSQVSRCPRFSVFMISRLQDFQMPRRCRTNSQIPTWPLSQRN